MGSSPSERAGVSKPDDNSRATGTQATRHSVQPRTKRSWKTGGPTSAHPGFWRGSTGWLQRPAKLSDLGFNSLPCLDGIRL